MRRGGIGHCIKGISNVGAPANVLSPGHRKPARVTTAATKLHAKSKAVTDGFEAQGGVHRRQHAGAPVVILGTVVQCCLPGTTNVRY